MPTADDFEENRASAQANIAQFASWSLMVASRTRRSCPRWPWPMWLTESTVASHSLRSCAACGSGMPRRGRRSSLRSRAQPGSDQLAAAVDLASAWMFAYIDVLSSFAEETYTREREHWLRTAAAAQTETIDAILGGRDVDSASASLRLGYELEREHVAVVGWYEAAEEGRDTIGALERQSASSPDALAESRPLIEPLGLLAVAAWIGSRSGFEDEVLDEPQVDTSLGPGARLAFGEPAHGVSGFRDSHREALHARRVATLAGRPPGSVTRYRRVALARWQQPIWSRRAPLWNASWLDSSEPTPRPIDWSRPCRSFWRKVRAIAARRTASGYMRTRFATGSSRLKTVRTEVGERTLELRVALALLNVVANPDEH